MLTPIPLPLFSSGSAMLLYIHVPFCRSRCRYCAFHSQAIGAGSVPDGYIDTLLDELACWASLIDAPRGGRRITSIFFGGGTPSLLAPRDIGTVIETADQCFGVAADAEITMEGNPESLQTRERAAGWTACGVNRFSMGVQSMHDDDLRRLGRIHTAAQVRSAVDVLRQAGDATLSMDLMWGLPGQNTHAWLDNLRQALDLGPTHLSCYALTLEEGTPMADTRWSGALALPDEDECERMYLEGCALMEDRGIVQYEISNFAARGRRCRHNMGYWHGLDYLGIGPAAVSTISGRRIEHPADTAVWRAQVRQGRIMEGAEPLSQHDRLLETVMLRLRTTDGLPLARCRAVGHDFAAAHATLIADLAAAGLLVSEPDRVRLTRRGLLVSNDIVARLFEEMEERGL